jgi:hypothetical protein
MEHMLTPKSVKLLAQQRQTTLPTSIPLLYRHKPFAQRRNVPLDIFRRQRRIVHLAPEVVNLGSVRLKGGADLGLEIVNDDKVGEKGKNVFYLQQIGGL